LVPLTHSHVLLTAQASYKESLSKKFAGDGEKAGGGDGSSAASGLIRVDASTVSDLLSAGHGRLTFIRFAAEAGALVDALSGAAFEKLHQSVFNAQASMVCSPPFPPNPPTKLPPLEGRARLAGREGRFREGWAPLSVH
jgi:hypothetical protein